MSYASTLRGERFVFADLRNLLAKANEVKSGDQLAGIAAHTDAQRNLISNIHARGVAHAAAAARIAARIERMLRVQASGVPIKEQLAGELADKRPPQVSGRMESPACAASIHWHCRPADGTPKGILLTDASLSDTSQGAFP